MKKNRGREEEIEGRKQARYGRSKRARREREKAIGRERGKG